jgi:DtxR family Mn-dependent transcriptional regulator
VIEPATVALASMGTGERGRFVRVSDSDPKLLRELAGLDIRPGDELEVVARGVRTGSATHRLRPALARSMRVEVRP